MTDSNLIPEVHFKNRFQTLESCGIAVEYYPCFHSGNFPLCIADVVLLSCALSGEAMYTFPNDISDTTSQEAHWIGIAGAGQPLAILTGSKGAEIYNMYLLPENLTPPLLPYDFQETLAHLLPLDRPRENRIERRIILNNEDLEHLRALLMLLEHESRHDEIGRPQFLQSCFRSFLIFLCRCAQKNGIDRQTAGHSQQPLWLDRVLKHIETDYASPQQLEDFAQLAGIAPATLCRQFKKSVGKTAFEYLNDVRIRQAMWRLRATNDKVLAVALECGFNDLAYFNRTFKRLTGLTPTAYRKSEKYLPSPES